MLDLRYRIHQFFNKVFSKLMKGFRLNKIIKEKYDISAIFGTNRSSPISRTVLPPPSLPNSKRCKVAGVGGRRSRQ